MSAGEPDWLTAMREELDRAEAGGWWWTHKDGSRSWVVDRPDGPRLLRACRLLLAEHDRTIAAAEQMAAALADFADPRHQQRSGSHICDWCGTRWPCDTAQATDALRAWQEQEAG